MTRGFNKGFTLLEVLIAMMILAGAMLVLFQSWNGSMAAIRKGRTYSTVTLLLQKKMTEFEITTKGKSIDEVKEEDAGDFGGDFPDYKWQIKMRPFVLPVVVPSTVPDSQKELVTTIMKTMADYFEKAVREVQVTVIYSRAGRKISYSLNTIYVDWTRDLPIGI